MSRNIGAYAGYTATVIKARASFPPQANMTVNGSIVQCVSLNTADIKTLLSETTNKKSLLLKSSNINPYSHFCPSWWQLSGGVISSSPDVAGYRFGDFAGYNHNAPTPSKSGFNTSGVIMSGGGTVNVYAHIDLGEIDWRSKVLFANIDAVKMEVKQGSIPKGSHTITYTDTTQQNGFDFSVNVSMTGAGTLTVNFYFVEDGVDLAPIPAISSHNLSVSVIYSAEIGTVALDSTLQAAHPTWELIYNEVTSEIDQINQQYTLYGLAIDNDSNGEGDVTRLNMELFARLNGGKWYSVMTGININVTGINIVDDALPWSVGNGDVIDFELRDGS